MNNHNLVIYEFDELYKILVEIKKDINLNFEKINKQQLHVLDTKSNYLILSKEEIPGLNNQIVFSYNAQSYPLNDLYYWLFLVSIKYTFYLNIYCWTRAPCSLSTRTPCATMPPRPASYSKPCPTQIV